MYTVAGNPSMVTVIQVTSLTPTVEVTWNKPSNGAEVTAFSVHYKLIGIVNDSFTLNVERNMLSVMLDQLEPRGTYEITVEAKSRHLSGFSSPVTVKLCKNYYILHNIYAYKSSTVILHGGTTIPRVEF